MVKFAAHQLFLLYIDGHICTSKRQKRDLFFISFYFVLVGHLGWREEDGRRMTISPHLVRFVLHGRNTPLALLIYSLILIKICIFLSCDTYLKSRVDNMYFVYEYLSRSENTRFFNCHRPPSKEHVQESKMQLWRRYDEVNHV